MNKTLYYCIKCTLVHSPTHPSNTLTHTQTNTNNICSFECFKRHDADRDRDSIQFYSGLLHRCNFVVFRLTDTQTDGHEAYHRCQHENNCFVFILLPPSPNSLIIIDLVLQHQQQYPIFFNQIYPHRTRCINALNIQR